MVNGWVWMCAGEGVGGGLCGEWMGVDVCRGGGGCVIVW